MSEKQKNVLGEDLEECSKNNPLTGWYREKMDGCCNTDENDHGVQLQKVCAKK